MADSKLSALTAATTAGGSDLLYLVQGTSSKKITVSNFLGGMGNVTFTGNVVYGGNAQTISAAGGVISIATPITHLTAGLSSGLIYIPAGSSGQIKYVTMLSTTGGAYTLSSNTSGNAAIVFDHAGDTAQLLFTDNKWFVVGGTANVTY